MRGGRLLLKKDVKKYNNVTNFTAAKRTKMFIDYQT